jgi:hypothetical protein
MLFRVKKIFMFPNTKSVATSVRIPNRWSTVLKANNRSGSVKMYSLQYVYFIIYWQFVSISMTTNIVLFYLCQGMFLRFFTPLFSCRFSMFFVIFSITNMVLPDKQTMYSFRFMAFGIFNISSKHHSKKVDVIWSWQMCTLEMYTECTVINILLNWQWIPIMPMIMFHCIFSGHVYLLFGHHLSSGIDLSITTKCTHAFGIQVRIWNSLLS